MAQTVQNVENAMSKCELLTVFYSYEWIRSKLICHTTPEQVIETPSKNTKRGGFLR